MKTNKVLWIACCQFFSPSPFLAQTAPELKHLSRQPGHGKFVLFSSPHSGPAMITDYSFDGSEGDPISLADAKQWAANYRDKNPGSTEARIFWRSNYQTDF